MTTPAFMSLDGALKWADTFAFEMPGEPDGNARALTVLAAEVRRLQDESRDLVEQVGRATSQASAGRTRPEMDHVLRPLDPGRGRR